MSPPSMGQLAGAALRDALTGKLLRESIGQGEIPLREVELAEGFRCQAAPDLIAQAAMPDGRVLATRGYHLYELAPEAAAFRRVRRLPCPPGKAWAAHYSCVRSHVGRSDVASVFALRSGAMLTLAGGFIFRRGDQRGQDESVFKLRHWGAGVGCGVMYCGIVQLPSGTVVIGEYFRNPDYEPVHLYKSTDDGRTWQLAHEFAAGRIRHVHSLQVDPVTGALWLCTGDRNDHSFVAWSDDEGQTFQQIGSGTQQWRVVRLQFTEDHVCWAADTNHPELRSVFRWSRATGAVDKLVDFGGPTITGACLAEGTWVFGTDREGTAGMQWVFGEDQPRRVTEPDEHPSLWISVDHERYVRLKMPRWLESARPSFAVTRVAIGEGAAKLAFTCTNVEQYNNYLFLAPERTLREYWQGRIASDGEGSDA